ncbi:MAG: RNase J family beta-CASP ribonuclease, partial [Actinomycetota bacterium]|nr:RNase J family beta-CASP ribonuclease [Actinomycetota bacterium]
MSHVKLPPPPALTKGHLRIVALGGLGEIGRNMMIYEYGETMIAVDVGLMFPDAEHPGVDLIIPDFEYVLEH